MKKISTSVSTGDIILDNSGIKGVVGSYKDGKIKISWIISNHSSISEYLSTKELNKRLKLKQII